MNERARNSRNNRFMNNKFYKKNFESNILKSAIDKDDTQSLIKLLQQGFSPNASIISGNKNEYILNYAITGNHTEIVDILLNSGANPNLKSPNSESFQISNGITEYNNSKLKPLAYFGKAAEYINFEIKEPTPLMMALNRDKSNDTDLSASIKQTEEIVSNLLKHGAKVDEKDPTYGLTPLHFAANLCQPNLIQKLIDKGANVSAQAITEGFPQTANYRRSSITPLLLATNKNKVEDSSNCIDILCKNGADISQYHLKARYFSEMISLYNNVNPKKSEEILFDVLDKDYKRMEHGNVNKVVDLYLSGKQHGEKPIEKCVELLLNKKFPQHDLFNDVKYLAHINSWSGPMPVQFNYDIAGKKEDTHLIEEGAGWIMPAQIPKRIKNLLYILDGVNNDKVDCPKIFMESKDVVLKKLKDEIYSQVSTYYTSQHIKYECDLVVPKTNVPQEFLLRVNLQNYITNKWSDIISDLKSGETFTIAGNPKGHSAIVEFKKDDKKTVSRSIYNIGGGSFYKHSATLDGRLFPHTAKNIPAYVFGKTNENPSQKALDYLKTILTSSHFEFRAENTTDRSMLHPELNKVYEGVYSLAKPGIIVNTIDGLKAGKMQLSFNCSSKSNMHGFKNRVQNDRLFKFVKNYEILSIKNNIKIDPAFIRVKELDKDTKNINWHILTGFNSPRYMEQNFFKFFSKRAPELSGNIVNKPGDRIASLIKTMPDKQAMTHYLLGCPTLISMLDKVAKAYNSKDLKELVNEYSTKFEIKATEAVDKKDSGPSLLEKLSKMPQTTGKSLIEM